MKEKEVKKEERVFNPEVTAQETQVYKKVGNGRLMEVLNTMFKLKMVTVNFLSYDKNKAEGQRAGDRITCYMGFEATRVLCHKAKYKVFEQAACEAYKDKLRKLVVQLTQKVEALPDGEEKKKLNTLYKRCVNAGSGNDINKINAVIAEVLKVNGITDVQLQMKPLFVQMGGTSAEKLKQRGMARADGNAESRQLKLTLGSKKRYMLVAEAGPGKQNEQGLIVPLYGNKPEKRIIIGMDEDELLGFALEVESHINQYVGATYNKISLNIFMEEITKYISGFGESIKGLLSALTGKKTVVSKETDDPLDIQTSETYTQENEPTAEEIKKTLEEVDDDLPF